MSPSEYQDLVAFLGERFQVIEGRFQIIEGRFGEVERRFGDLERQLSELRLEILGHFDELYRRLERLEQEYIAITQALRRIEAALGDERVRREHLERDLAALRENVAALRSRIDALE